MIRVAAEWNVTLMADVPDPRLFARPKRECDAVRTIAEILPKAVYAISVARLSAPPQPAVILVASLDQRPKLRLLLSRCIFENFLSHQFDRL